MKIDINKDYCITGDSMQWVLNSKRVSDGEKTKGQEIVYPIGFFGSLNQCLNSLVDRELRMSEVESFRDLINVLNRVNEEILTACTIKGYKVSQTSREI